MRKMKEKNRIHIQQIFEEKTGVDLRGGERRSRVSARGLCAAAACVCLLTLSAFAYGKFSSLDEDELDFDSVVYLGDGIVSVTVTNKSDKDLVFEKRLKLMQWKDSVEITGDSRKVSFENVRVPAHSSATVRIDLSEAYDIEALEQPLEGGNWYYLVLTNNGFAFGQDWMCSVDFDERSREAVSARKKGAVSEEKVPEPARPLTAETVFSESWAWPTESHEISAVFGEQPLSGAFSDHVNIKGLEGDKVYAVAEATVAETGFSAERGNYCLLDDGQGNRILYGHLRELLVEEGQEVSRGEQIGTLGKSGMAAGCNLLFAVYVDGEAVDPLERTETKPAQ